MKRREFISFAGCGLAAMSLPRLASAEEPSGYGRLLVLVELKGGNDGLNTVVPYRDPAYYALRPRTSIKADDVIPLDERAGLHPALQPLLPIWSARELAVVQGVGYPDPNLSHFRSIEIWDTASKSGEYLDQGWLTRTFNSRPVPPNFAADGVVVGSSDMGPLAGPGVRTIALNDTNQFLRQARLADATGHGGNAALNHILKIENDIVLAASRLVPRTEFRTAFPKTPFGNAIRTAALLASNPAGVSVIRLSLNGFDTHQNQPAIHQRLLAEFAEGIAALRDSLMEIGRWNSTLLMTYAEFGRRPRENNSNGTDHGTASVHFVAGGKVKGGLYGPAPRLESLEGGNLVYGIDFRSLYATALEKWWGVPSAGPLGGRYPLLDVV